MTRFRNAGFTLTELLVTLGLLSAFALIASHLFTSVFKVVNHNTQAIEIPMRFDAAVAVLRTDIATSTGTESPNRKSLSIETATGTIQWHSDAHQLIRQSPTTQRSWDVVVPIEFQREGKVILVHAPNSIADIPLAPQLTVAP